MMALRRRSSSVAVCLAWILRPQASSLTWSVSSHTRSLQRRRVLDRRALVREDRVLAVVAVVSVFPSVCDASLHELCVAVPASVLMPVSLVLLSEVSVQHLMVRLRSARQTVQVVRSRLNSSRRCRS